MTLREMIDDDALAVFCNEDDFAESITYKPHRYYGEAARSDRVISAVVMREQITVFGQNNNLPQTVYQVHVHNNSTTGIASDELDLGGDKLEFPPRDGEDSEVFSITQLVTQDHGMLVLECR